jgi:hypothetical protein
MFRSAAARPAAAKNPLQSKPPWGGGGAGSSDALLEEILGSLGAGASNAEPATAAARPSALLTPPGAARLPGPGAAAAPRQRPPATAPARPGAARPSALHRPSAAARPGLAAPAPSYEPPARRLPKQEQQDPQDPQQQEEHGADWMQEDDGGSAAGLGSWDEQERPAEEPACAAAAPSSEHVQPEEARHQPVKRERDEEAAPEARPDREEARPEPARAKGPRVTSEPDADEGKMAGGWAAMYDDEVRGGWCRGPGECGTVKSPPPPYEAAGSWAAMYDDKMSVGQGSSSAHPSTPTHPLVYHLPIHSCTFLIPSKPPLLPPPRPLFPHLGHGARRRD